MTRIDTKTKIFYAAAELFAEKCYADVSVRDIADKAGIKSATIYYHYGSKEDILEDLLAFYDKKLDQLLEDTEKSHVSTMSPEARFISTILDIDPEERELMGWLTKIVFNEQFRNQKAADIIFDKSLKQRANAYKAFLQQLCSDSEISERDCQRYAELFAGIQVLYAMKSVNRLAENEDDTRPTMEELMTFVMSIAMERLNK